MFRKSDILNMHTCSVNYEGYCEQLFKLFESFRMHSCFRGTLFFNVTSNVEIFFQHSSNRDTTENLEPIVKHEPISDERMHHIGKSQ